MLGGGSGNDTAIALKEGAQQADTVEIDPVLIEFGRDLHPQRPYADPRVHTFNDDARAFLRRDTKPYDLIVMNALDSHHQRSAKAFRIKGYTRRVASTHTNASARNTSVSTRWDAAKGLCRRVRLEVRKTIDTYDVRNEADWPLPSTQYRKAMLDAATRTLAFSEPKTESRLVYDSQGERGATFEMRFDTATELTGQMKLALFVATDTGDDIDLLVGLEKLDAAGNIVYFEGRENDVHGLVSNGWLRVSHR